MTGLVLRLAVGGGRGAAARLVLVVLGTALAAALLLVAVGVATVDRADLAITGSATVVTAPDGTVELLEDPGSTGPVSSPYLVEPELRRGVVLGFVLCVVPLVVFVATAARVAARRRDERLAGLRLAGATGGQVRALAALDTAVGAVAGAVLGVGLFVAARAVARSAGGEVADVAAVVTPSPAGGLLVLLLMVLLSTAAASLLLRTLVISPLGVARRALRRHPRPWGLLLLLGSLLGFALTVQVEQDSGDQDLLLGLCLAGAMVGLVTCGPWLTSLTGRAAGALARRPSLLLAGRRLEDEPRAQARATAPVVLVVLAGTLALLSLEDFRAGGALQDDFAATGFTAAGVGIVFSLLVGVAGVLLTTVEGVLERRRTLAALHASGVPRGVLARSVLLQALLPVAPASVLAVLTGLATGLALGLREVPATVVLLPLAALAATVLAGLAALPGLRVAVDPEALRAC